MQQAALDFVFYLSSDWETFHRPDMLYAFARAVAKRGGRVLCIDRLMCPFTGSLRGFLVPMAGPSRTGKWARMLTATCLRKNPIEPLADNLYLGRAFTFVDERIAHRVPAFLPINRRVVGRQVRAMMERIGFGDRPIATWFHFPLWVDYVGLLSERLSVYECYDEHTGIAGLSPTEVSFMERLERRLFKAVDLVFVTSGRLLEAKRSFHERIRHVPNGADVGFYAKVQDDAQPVDAALASLPHPVIGFMGMIQEHMDLGLMRFVAETHPEWSIVLAGKVEQRKVAQSDDFRALLSLPNVVFPGWIGKDRQLAVCKAFDVAVIPYRRDSLFNRFRNPNKLHEYTAMGKPIVTQEGLDVDTHSRLIWITKTREQFVTAIQEAIESDSAKKIEERLRFAQEGSWDNRVRVMLEEIDAWSAKSPAINNQPSA